MKAPKEVVKQVKINLKRLKVKEFSMTPLQDRTWYPARYTEAEVNEKGLYGPCCFLKFEMLAGEKDDGTPAKGLKLSTLTSTDLTPNSKLMILLKSLSGQDEFDIGEEVDMTAWYGNKYDVFIENKKAKKDGQMRSNIVAVAPWHHMKKKHKKH